VLQRLTALLVVAAASVAIGASVATTAQAPVATASAYGITVIVPGQPGASAATVAVPGATPAGTADAFAYPADGSLVRTGALSSSVFARTTGVPAAQAVTDVLAGSLFNGEITWESAGARAKTGATGGDAAGSNVQGLVVLGQPVAAAPNARIALGDWGFLVTLEQALEASADADSSDNRVGVTALHVTLTAEHAGLPPGTEILVAHGDAATSIPVPEKPPTTPPRTTTTVPEKPTERSVPPKRKPRLPKPPEPGKAPPGLRSPIIRPIPTDIDAPLSPQGYVFPVYGPVSFGDTYGAPRATVTWHHGEDLFAPLGAPVLAVADGTVFSVGWNDIGGFRFWLRDRQGNQFYYAHLSAFSPLAVDGTEVRAGQVIGFVGNTGDAKTTPYHLHFEIHPVALLPMGYDGVVKPYPYLLAWRRLQDVSLAAGRGWAPPVPPSARAPQPGAFLLGAVDISSASGLEPGSLQRTLDEAAAASGDGSLLGTG
jgi:murein DD-endopeptidase MepM/ murein hydrolase activator NlpD